MSAAGSRRAKGPEVSRSSKRLGAPSQARVRAGPGGVPAAFGGVAVDVVREDWVVEDRWWSGRAVRRRYFELVLTDGRNVVVFHDLSTGRWLVQRA